MQVGTTDTPSRPTGESRPGRLGPAPELMPDTALDRLRRRRSTPPSPPPVAQSPKARPGRRDRDPVAGVLLVAAGVILGTGGLAVLLQPSSSAAAAAVTPLGVVPTVGTAAPHVTRGPAPTSLSIPGIGVATPLLRLGLTKGGELQVPTDFSRAGWWTGGARPGDVGTAVIVGHIDSLTGGAVFFRLGELKPGQKFAVTRADGSVATFTVDARREFSKRAFPSTLVYAATRNPSLRLITCGGRFDEKTHSYRDNVVVFAHLHAVTKPKPKTKPKPAAKKATA